MRSRFRTAAAAFAVTALLAVVPASAATADPDTAEPTVGVQAVPVIATGAMGDHLAALQDIADSHNGNRAAGTSGYDASVDYVAGKLNAAGYDVTRQRCRTCTHSYDRNVLASWPGSGNGKIVIGAHLDGVRAGPGIEDNGSGSSALLEIALAVARTRPSFERTVVFAWWAEEELGMHGSRHYVDTVGVAGVDAYIGMDMIAGTNGGYFLNNLGAGHVAPFARYLRARDLAPEDFTDCCSDDLTFANAGVPSTLLTTGYGEDKTAAQALKWGGTAGRPYDPCYHTACDTYPENIDFIKLGNMANAAATGLWSLAGGKQINPYTPEEACGSGYKVIDVHSLGASLATVYLLYRSSTGRNCVVTLKNGAIGSPSQVSATLQVEGSTKKSDSGAYSYYAGPVTALAPSQCVRWGGSAGTKSWLSGYEHCG